MGVSGAGKTTIGERLAADLGWPFHDGDDLHPRANVEKMRRGVALTDEDRAPWLAAVAALIARLVADGTSAVLACSALRQAYRERLAAAGRGAVGFVHLTAPPDVIRARLLARGGHFMKADLLDSQLATLEPPPDVLTVDVTDAPDVVVARIRRALAL